MVRQWVEKEQDAINALTAPQRAAKFTFLQKTV
jgi:hypothetical protein